MTVQGVQNDRSHGKGHGGQVQPRTAAKQADSRETHDDAKESDPIWRPLHVSLGLDASKAPATHQCTGRARLMEPKKPSIIMLQGHWGMVQGARAIENLHLSPFRLRSVIYMGVQASKGVRLQQE